MNGLRNQQKKNLGLFSILQDNKQCNKEHNILFSDQHLSKALQEYHNFLKEKISSYTTAFNTIQEIGYLLINSSDMLQQKKKNVLVKKQIYGQKSHRIV